MSYPAVIFHTLGCKLNQAETELFARDFLARGYQMGGEQPQTVVVNTCTVTHVADRKSRHFIRMMRREHPGSFIVATGCYAQRSPEEARKAGADLVVLNQDKGKLAATVRSLRDSNSLPPGKAFARGDGFRVRSFVKAQDGCDNACAYCIVPQVRGKPVSLPREDVVSETAARAAEGYQEVVLTGTKIGSYRHNGAGLVELVESLLRQTGIPRLRLSSLQPREVTPQLLSLWNDRRLCPHFHLALQSGSQRVLGSMGRPYSVDQYRQTVSAIRSVLPDAAITTDIIAGFPGETDGDFDQTYRLCRELGFAAINVFPYSPRPSTQAARLPGRVDERTKRQRVRAMLDLAAESREKFQQKFQQQFQQQFLGREMTVLWEKETSPGVYSGLTENSIRVAVQSAARLTNRLTPTRLMKLDKGLLWGQVERAFQGG